MIGHVSAFVYNERPAGVRFAPDTVAEPGRSELEDEIWAWIVRGDDDAAAFVDHLDDDEERHGLGDEELAAAYERAVDARLAQQREWGAVQGNLSRAFAELNEMGVLARENFSCCSNCASSEIHDERDESRHWHGYLWFHQQDTEALVASTDGSVYLGYGAYPPEDFDEAAYEALSKKKRRARYRADLQRMLDDLVFPVLRRHGMQVIWNGDHDTRILVTGANWYVPLT